MLVFIFPSIVIPVVLVVIANYLITGNKITTLQYDLLKDNVGFIRSKSESNFQTIDALGMSDVAFFTETTKQVVLLNLEENLLQGESVTIVDYKLNTIVFSAGFEYPKLLTKAILNKKLVSEKKGTRELNIKAKSGETLTMLAAFDVFPRWDWIIVSAIDKNHLFRYTFDAMVLTSILGGAFLAFIFLIVYKLANGISLAVVTLEKGARQLSENNLDVEINLELKGNNEFTRLATSFNTMVSEIKNTQNQLKGSINKEKRVNNELHESTERHRITIQTAMEGFLLVDSKGYILEANEAYSRMSQYSNQELLGMQTLKLDGNTNNVSKKPNTEDYIELGKEGRFESQQKRKDGSLFNVEISLKYLPLAGGCSAVFIRDITKYKIAEQKIVTANTELARSNSMLERYAHYDFLTQLPNRVLLADRLHLAMAHCDRQKQSLAVVFLDLDDFKAVNDKYGHKMGDELLIVIAQRLKTALREGDTLSRIGGDEFVAVLGELKSQMDCDIVLQRLLNAAAETSVINDISLNVSSSIGVTIYPQDGADADQLLRHADQAMYQAKQAGKNRYHLFDVAENSAIHNQHEQIELIHIALLRNEFVLHYQPKVNMRTGQVIGLEALIRWQHPKLGLLVPESFLPTIEEHPLIIELGEWVMNSTLTQMKEWQRQGLNISVSVNLSARHLMQDNFFAKFTDILAHHRDIKPGLLELEILETSALKDIIHISQLMNDCRSLGVHFALDDFGTGYSSLTYLRQLPAAILKIDQSFVRDMIKDPDDLAIVKGIIGLASAFQCNVIAEGVETEALGKMLLSLGCEQAQGFGIAHPMPTEAVFGWVANWQTDPKWIA